MQLKDKMFKLTTATKKLIEKQVTKDGYILKKDWYKPLICTISETDDGDTFFTIYNKTKKTFYTTCAILNELDDFDSFLGETIAINRMGRNINFIKDTVTEISFFNNFVREVPIIFGYNPSKEFVITGTVTGTF